MSGHPHCTPGYRVWESKVTFQRGLRPRVQPWSGHCVPGRRLHGLAGTRGPREPGLGSACRTHCDQLSWAARPVPCADSALPQLCDWTVLSCGDTEPVGRLCGNKGPEVERRAHGHCGLTGGWLTGCWLCSGLWRGCESQGGGRALSEPETAALTPACRERPQGQWHPNYRGRQAPGDYRGAALRPRLRPRQGRPCGLAAALPPPCGTG